MELRQTLRQCTVCVYSNTKQDVWFILRKRIQAVRLGPLQSTADYCLLWHSRIRATSLSARTLNTPHHTLDPLQRWRPENQPIPPGHGNMPLGDWLWISFVCWFRSRNHPIPQCIVCINRDWPWISQLRPGTLQMQQSEPDRGLETGQAAGVTGRVDHPGVAVRNADGE